MKTLLFLLALTSQLFGLDVQVHTTDNIDLIWRQYCPLGTAADPVVFHYDAGTFQTRGAHFEDVVTMQSHNYHIGAGIDRTIIQLVGADQKTADGTIFSNFGRWVTDWSCSYLTLDINAKGNPKWYDPANQAAMSAVSCWGGDHITMEQVKVANFGTPVPGSECFPVSFFSNGSGAPNTMDHILVQDCFFGPAVTGNKDGCTVVGMVDDVPDGVYMGPDCVVNNCYFQNLRSDFTYLHCVGAPRVTNCYAVNSGTFWFAEPVRVIYPRCGVFIDNNWALGMELVRVKTHPGGEIGDATQGADFIIGPNNVTKFVYP